MGCNHHSRNLRFAWPGEQAVELVLQLLGGAMLRIILQYAAQAQSRFHQVAHLELLLGELVQQLALVRCNASSGAAQAHDRRFALTHIGQAWLRTR